MDDTRGLFGILGGIPAQGMVVGGILFSLLVPLIPQCANASRDAASADLERAKTLYKLDQQEFKRKQADERETEAEARKKFKPPADESAVARRDREETERKQRKKAEEAREKALKQHGKDLDAKYNLPGLERAEARAKADAAGVRSHLFFNWLGRFLLVLGLLIMTINATGTQQKVLLVVLVIVLLGSLTGIGLDVGAKAHLGT